ncbi:MAG TPA: pre-peptidase C-terminal domain-containing protein, partial [Pirellulaceae bacterium]|nr:pre-peptidase C-terminal domain-containing protein [Pirellulaceae bacterium]
MRIAATCCALAVSFFSASIGWAAPPNVLGLYPAGLSRGQTTVVTASGTIPDWPVQLKADRPGLSFECDKEKGKIKVTVAADAAPGVYWVRVFNDDGAAMPRPLIVGSVREIEEVEPNDAPDKPQLLDGPATINGRIGKAGDVDSYAIRLTAGQKIVASLQANNLLNSPMDGVIQFAQLEGYVAPSNSAAPAGNAPASAAGGGAQPAAAAAPVNSGPTAANPLARRPEAFVLAQKDDETGLDPRLVATAPRDGYYLVRVFAFPSETNANVSFAGGDNYVYRLTITTQPFLDFALPLAISKANPSPLHLRGWNLPEALATLPAPAPRDGEQDWAAAERALFSVARAEAAGGMELPWTDFPTVIADATASPEKPQIVAWPVSISGVIEEPRDVDAFQVTATKGQKLRLKVDARSLGFPLDPVVQVLDATGKSLVELDDANNQRDVETVFTVPADGAYRVAVRDIHQHGGERYAYR